MGAFVVAVVGAMVKVLVPFRALLAAFVVPEFGALVPTGVLVGAFVGAVVGAVDGGRRSTEDTTTRIMHIKNSKIP